MALVGVIVGYAVAAGGGLSASTAPAPAPTVAADPAPTPARPPAPEAGDVEKVDPKVDHIRGNKKAPISVIEYSDFECPFCTRHHATMQALVDDADYKDKANWVYRHFPLGFHPNAQKAAEASECAGDQDKFWEYTDTVFDGNGVERAKLTAYAEKVSLNMDKFEDCLDSGKYEQKVKDQMAAGSAGGVRGTPGNIVINNKTGEAKLVSGAQGVDAFKAAIDSLL